MKKSDKFKTPIRVDNVTNEYIIAVPESYVNELNWYEDTEVNISLTDDGLYIEEEWTQLSMSTMIITIQWEI
mgnify:CR=1 FL=1